MNGCVDLVNGISGLTPIFVGYQTWFENNTTFEWLRKFSALRPKGLGIGIFYAHRSFLIINIIIFNKNLLILIS